jgi:hypothetical protein
MAGRQWIADVISAAVIATDARVDDRSAIIDQQTNDPADHVASPTIANIAYHRRCVRQTANWNQTIHNHTEAIHDRYQQRLETFQPFQTSTNPTQPQRRTARSTGRTANSFP